MARLILDYKLAMAASLDAGYRHMRKHGRKVWNDDDYNHACATFNRLYPQESTATAPDRATIDATS